MTYSTPAAEDLSTLVGESVDDSRADLLIAQAEKLCISVVSPLPTGADVVVLTAALRAYTNPQGVTYEAVGSYGVSRPQGGVYLTKAERGTLRRMNGGGSAFGIDLIAGYSTRFDS